MPMPSGRFVTSIVLCLSAAAFVRAQDAEIDLAAAARQAAEQFAPITPQQLETARANLAQAVNRLEAFLKSGAAFKATGWKRYLGWTDLAGIATAQEPASAELTQSLIARLTADQTGLDLKQFTEVRQALQNYQNVVAAAAHSSLQVEHQAKLAKLATHLEAYAKDLTSGDDALAIGQLTGWLSRANQAEELRKLIRAKYARPNVFGFASKDLMAAGVEEEIDRTAPIRDSILGTSIFGTGRMTGRTTLVLNENPAAAAYTVLLKGAVASRNVGYNGPVTIHSTGYTSVAASKGASATAAGLSSTPSLAQCGTSSRITGISANRRLVQRVAWNRASEQKGEADAIGAAHAAARIRQDMDAEAAKSIGGANDDYQKKFRHPLLRRGGFPEEYTYSTTPDRVLMRIMEAGDSQIGAPVPPPEHHRTNDLNLRAHESSVVNFSEYLIGGQLLTDVDIVRILSEDLGREVPEELQLSPDKDHWSITFTKDVPFRAQFRGQQVRMAIRGRTFTKGDQRMNDPVEIAALYSVQMENGGSKLTRLGDVEVTYLDRERLGATQVAFKTFLRRKFGSLFKPELTYGGLKMKGRFAKVGTLPLRELNADAAWITLGWDLPTRSSGGQ